MDVDKLRWDFASICSCLLVSLLLVGCEKKNTIEHMRSEVPIQAVTKTSGIVFSSEAEVLYHFADKERHPGLIEWIISDRDFSLTDQAIAIDILEMPFTESTAEMLRARLGNEAVTKAGRAVRLTWENSGRSFRANYLEAEDTIFVLITKLP